MNIKKEVEAAFRSMEPLETTLRRRFHTTRHTWEKVLKADCKLSEPLKLFRSRIAGEAADIMCRQINLLRRVENGES